jgi:hypothetical protein
MKPDDPSLVSPGRGKITLQNSVERLDQLRVTVHPEEESEPKSSKPSVEASEANDEIASENDPQCAEKRD